MLSRKLYTSKPSTGILSGCKFFAFACCLLLTGILGIPDAAWAVQVHGPPEGYYTHMLAHLFFAAALVFLLFLLYRRPIGSGRGWRYFKLSLLFFLLWNIDTFIFHWLSSQLPVGVISGQGSPWTQRLNLPLTVKWWIYYFSRLDHLLCLPAIWFLVQCLRTFCLQIEKGDDRPGEMP